MASLKIRRADVGLGLRREWESLLLWAGRGGCQVNYRKIPGLIETVYLDVIVEGDISYVNTLYRWIKEMPS